MVALTRDHENPTIQEPQELPEEETSRVRLRGGIGVVGEGLC